MDIIETFSFDLINCQVATIESSKIIRSGPIDSQKRVQELFSTVEEPFYLSITQVNSIEDEWELINKQHLTLETCQQKKDSPNQIMHLIFPLESIYTTKPRKIRLKKEEDYLLQLPRLNNMEAWISICYRYNELLEKAFANFAYDALDQYTLEKFIKDFRHEVYSDFLKRTLKKLNSLQEKISDLNINYRDLISFEKELINCRGDLKRMVQAHYNILVEIVRVIPIVEKAHPELIKAKETGLLLKKLLDDELGDVADLKWVQKEIILQLLNDELDIISAVNCNTGIDRTNFAFSARLAILQMKDKFTKQEIFDFALGENFVEATLLIDFQQRVLDNLIKYSLPLTNQNRASRSLKKWEEDMSINSEILLCLPPEHQGKQIVDLDPETKSPIDLTEFGRELVLSFLL